MNNIRKIKLSKNDFIIFLENSSLKLNYKNDSDKYIIDISTMNLISAIKMAILCSTYCFINNFKKKLCWLVQDEEIKRAISLLRLNNIDSIVVGECSIKERAWA